MKTSESIIKIIPALLAAQKSITFAVKDTTNLFFKSKYADLPSVIDSIKKPLNDAGIVFIQTAGHSDHGYLAMTTRLIHESGEWIEDTATVPLTKCDPQGYGSACTYARRYALAAITGLYQDDDDGNAASRNKNAAKTAKTGLHESSKSIGQAATETLTDEQMAIARLWADSIIDAKTAGDSPEEDMYRIYESVKEKHAGDVEFVTAVWNLLDSKIRSSIKKTGSSLNAK